MVRRCGSKQIRAGCAFPNHSRPHQVSFGSLRLGWLGCCTLLDSGIDQPIERMQDVAWTPDGLTLAYTRLTSTGVCCDLVLYDLREEHAQHQVQIDPPLRTQAQGIMWAPDGRHLVISTSTDRVIVVARDGTVVGTAPVGQMVDAVRLTNTGTVVLVLHGGEQSILRTMTWATGTQVQLCHR